MARTTYYVQECPTCGRKLQVRVEYLGRRVVCQHCHAEFAACDPSNDLVEDSASSSTLLQRAEELIAAASRSGLNLRMDRVDRTTPGEAL